MPLPGKPDVTPAAAGRRGFSLTEVLIAVSLLGVIFLAVYGLISAGSRRAYGGKKMTQAAVIAQTVMERANTYAPQDILGAASTASTITKTWTRTGAATTTPAAEGTSNANMVERNAWRALLANADMPASASDPAVLEVTMTAVPAGRTFANASMVRVLVDVSWSEWGTRRRQVRLQSLNLRVTP